MGKGDRKTKRGKINRASYGNARPHTVKTTGTGKVVSKAAPAKKAPARKKAS